MQKLTNKGGRVVSVRVPKVRSFPDSRLLDTKTFQINA
jgi:hypothetical protein